MTILKSLKYTALLLLTSPGCSQTQKENPYSDIMDRIPKEFHDFFVIPMSSDSIFMNFNEFPYCNSFEAKPTYYYVQYSSSNIDSLVSSVDKVALAIYSFPDSCNVVVYKFQNKKSYISPTGREWLYKEWVSGLNHCGIRLPIPNFLGLDYPDFIPGKGLSADYLIYVLNVDSNRVFDSRYYGPEIIMPYPWRTGHSSGICISKEKNKAISWLIIW
jgi:hypothetical protein